jgi:hypothetical protein
MNCQHACVAYVTCPMEYVTSETSTGRCLAPFPLLAGHLLHLGAAAPHLSPLLLQGRLDLLPQTGTTWIGAQGTIRHLSQMCLENITVALEATAVHAAYHVQCGVLQLVHSIASIVRYSVPRPLRLTYCVQITCFTVKHLSQCTCNVPEAAPLGSAHSAATWNCCRRPSCSPRGMLFTAHTRW